MDNRDDMIPEELDKQETERECSVDVYSSETEQQEIYSDKADTQEKLPEQINPEPAYEGWQPQQNEKSGKGLAIAVFGSLGLLVIILVVIVATQLRGVTKDGIQVKLPDWSSLFEKEQDEAASAKDNDSDISDTIMNNDSFDNIDWDDTSWKKEHVQYTPEQIAGEYYEDIVDCIDTSVNYSTNREFFEYTDKERNVCIRIAYIQLEGDIPNLENLNEEIKEETLYLAKIYDEQKERYDAYVDEYGGGYIACVDSYVTFNSDDRMSIVLDESYHMADESKYLGLYGININLQTGTLLDNTEILKMDEQFASDLKKRSKKQNGAIAAGVDDRTDKEVEELLNSENNLIIFYTPLGMEVGYSYSIDYTVGWMTVTYKDFEQYENAL